MCGRKDPEKNNAKTRRHVAILGVAGDVPSTGKDTHEHRTKENLIIIHTVLVTGIWNVAKLTYPWKNRTRRCLESHIR